MNTELQRQLTDMLSKLLSAIESGATWTGEQIPLLVQEKILLGRVSLTFWVITGIVVALYALPYAARQFKLAAEIIKESGTRYFADEEVTAVARGIGGGLVGGTGVIVALANIESAFTVWFAPRLYIIEWLSTLAK